MQRQHGGGRRQQRVFPLLGIPARMGRFADKGHVQLGCSQGAPGARRHVAVVESICGCNMGTDEIIHIVHMPRGGNGPRAAGAFLRRLENQLHRTVQAVFHCHEDFRHAQPDRHVGVMAAGVHHAGIAAGKAFPGGAVAGVGAFRHGQGVNIKPQGHHRAGAAVQDANDARQALPHLRG